MWKPLKDTSHLLILNKMPRRSLTRTVAATRRRGRKWSPVLVQEEKTMVLAASNQTVEVFRLCANSSNTQTGPTATIIKCGNFKLNFDVQSSSNTPFAGYGQAYVMFAPQGVNPTVDYPNEHPEYIMAWRSFDPGYNALQSLSLQTKLKRNLNSGDAVVLVVRISNISSTQQTIAFHHTTTFVCCNN